MVIEEDIMPVAAKSGTLRQKLPDLIKGRPPDGTNLLDANLSPNGCQRSGRDGFNGDIDGHDRPDFPSGIPPSPAAGLQHVGFVQASDSQAFHRALQVFADLK